MSHQDKMSGIVINHQTLKQVVDVLLPATLFRSLHFRAGATWRPRMLAVAALLWGCQDGDTLEGRFRQARNIAAKIFHWFAAPGNTYEGFKKVLKVWHQEYKLLLMEQWHGEMLRIMPAPWTIEGYLILSGDGSRFELPRTRSHEEHYAPSRKRKKQSRKGRQSKKKSKAKKSHAKRGRRRSATRRPAKQSSKDVDKKTTSPQMWLTLLWHVGTGLPWDWRSGPSDSSERDHVREMLHKLPENALLVADAGFVGYDFWKAILDANRQFLIRVGGNVKLLRNLGYAREHKHVVYLWPDKAAKQKQEPLVLRLVVVHNGKEPVYLVTNLPKCRLSDQQAARVYAARWGIELFFRTFKQTFQRRKLRSRSAENAELELDWSLLALWGMLLMGKRELANSGQDQSRQSPVHSIRAFHDTIQQYRLRPESREACLWYRLRNALLDDYERHGAKASRGYPRKKKRQRTVAPTIQQATKQQKLAAKQLKQREQKIRLAA